MIPTKLLEPESTIVSHKYVDTAVRRRIVKRFKYLVWQNTTPTVHRLNSAEEQPRSGLSATTHEMNLISILVIMLNKPTAANAHIAGDASIHLIVRDFDKVSKSGRFKTLLDGPQKKPRSSSSVDSVALIANKPPMPTLPSPIVNKASENSAVSRSIKKNHHTATAMMFKLAATNTHRMNQFIEIIKPLSPMARMYCQEKTHAVWRPPQCLVRPYRR